MLSGIANSVDPDQTTQSDLGLHCLHMPNFCVRNFGTFTVIRLTMVQRILFQRIR